MIPLRRIWDRWRSLRFRRLPQLHLFRRIPQLFLSLQILARLRRIHLLWPTSLPPQKIPLSMWLPDFFFALGPWRYPDFPVRPGPLSTGDRVFWGTRSQPLVRFMFETLHDQTCSTQSIANALYDEIIIEDERLFGHEIYHLISAQFDDAIGRLVWSQRESF